MLSTAMSCEMDYLTIFLRIVFLQILEGLVVMMKAL